jgi:hypothetical protein
MMPMLSALPNHALHSSMTWTFVKKAEYSQRDDGRHFQHNGLHWLSHGYREGIPGAQVFDLWNSEDAMTWNLVRLTTPWMGLAPVVSFNGEIVALAEKVYRSTDNGVTITVALETPPWNIIGISGDISGWRALVRNGYLLLFQDETVWYTQNLTDWDVADLPWYRLRGALWDLNGYVYAAAGNNTETADPPETNYPNFTSLNDVWRSADPTAGPGSWTELTASAPWAQRMWPGFCVHGDEMVIAGGYDNVTGGSNFDDTWVSRDGITWREIGGTAYPDVHAPNLISASGRLLIQNGNRYPTGTGVIRDIFELRLQEPAAIASV